MLLRLSNKISLFLVLACAATAAHATSPSASIPIQGGQTVLIAQDQQLMLQAARKVIEKNYPAALSLYDQAIGINPGNIEAYIQRSVVKREMNNPDGSQADAAMAVRLSEAALSRDPQNPMLYYQRGMGYRFLKDFPHAKENIRYAMQISHGQHGEWDTDLKAIELEEKMNQ